VTEGNYKEILFTHMLILLISSVVVLLTLSIRVRRSWHEGSYKPPQQIMKACRLSDTSKKPIQSLERKNCNCI
jgi:hypothetical protein